MNIAQNPTTTDEIVIKAVIREETDAFIAADLERWAACWVHSERTHDVMIARDIGCVVIKGWDKVYAHMCHAFETGAGCGKNTFTHSNMSISVTGDMAWATFDSVATGTSGETIETFETRVLERVQGHWRIAYSAFVHLTQSMNTERRVAVDREGQIIWITDPTRDAIANHPGLTISNGRLRAARPAWDQTLQDAFRRADALSGFFEQFGYIAEKGRAFRCPVVLGEDDAGGIVSCIVALSDGLIYVDIGMGENFSEQLAIATAIFGLSPAQSDLVNEILSGKTVIAAARALKISENTARTQLSRVFDKTGVNSQPALVRILMSVG